MQCIAGHELLKILNYIESARTISEFEKELISQADFYVSPSNIFPISSFAKPVYEYTNSKSEL